MIASTTARRIIRKTLNKQTFLRLRNIFTPTDQNILLMSPGACTFPIDTRESPFESLRFLSAEGRHQGIPGHLHNDIYIFFVDLTCIPSPGGPSWRSYHKSAKGIQSPVTFAANVSYFLYQIGHLLLENYL